MGIKRRYLSACTFFNYIIKKKGKKVSALRAIIFRLYWIKTGYKGALSCFFQIFPSKGRIGLKWIPKFGNNL